jgi:hypothetical protein
MSNTDNSHNAAYGRFERARRQARIEQFSNQLTGRNQSAIPFERIRTQLKHQNPWYKGVQDIPVAAVVGSVGRYIEFSRTFLPLNDAIRERWIGIDKLAGAKGWPPIELYQVGNSYYVKDGNHRLSVANQLQMPTIEAHVWAFPVEIEINVEDTLDALLIRFGERAFFEKTGLNKRHPNHNIRFTSAGRYTELLAQIEDLGDKLAIIDGQKMPYYDAVDAWFEMIYLPTIQIIRDSTLLNDFPGRSESDLFVWMSGHRDGLQLKYGTYENLAVLAAILANEYKERHIQKLTRQMRRLLGNHTLPPLAESQQHGTVDTIDS